MAKPASLLRGYERTIATAKANGARQAFPDPETTGLSLVISPKGKRIFSVIARDPTGKQIWKTIAPGDTPLDEVRILARQAVTRIKSGEDALPPPPEPEAPPETFRTVAERFIKRWVDTGGRKKNGVPLRSKAEIERHLKVYLYPDWEDRPFVSIRRGDVTKALDRIADDHGPAQADRVYDTISRLTNWYRAYDETYVPPVIVDQRKGGTASDRARDRTLNDDELRAVWKACDDAGTFGRFIKLALLSGQRRAKLAGLKWTDIVDGVWHIPNEPHEKGTPPALKLSRMALEIVEEQPRIAGNEFVFAGRGDKAMNGFSACKRDLDEALAIPRWTVHDCRRSARSLMSRAGVLPHVAERVLGHVVGNVVERTYDRHDFSAEMAQALEALASLVARIVSGGDGGNVVNIKGAA